MSLVSLRPRLGALDVGARPTCTIFPRNFALVRQLLDPGLRGLGRERSDSGRTPPHIHTLRDLVLLPSAPSYLQATVVSHFSPPALPTLEGMGLLVGELTLTKVQSLENLSPGPQRDKKLIVRQLSAMAACPSGKGKWSSLLPPLLAPSLGSPLPSSCGVSPSLARLPRHAALCKACGAHGPSRV